MIDLGWQPHLSSTGHDAMDRFASYALTGQQPHDCGHTNNNLICPCTATLPPRQASDQNSGGVR